MNGREARALEHTGGIAAAMTAPAVNDYRRILWLQLAHPSIELLNGNVDRAGDVPCGKFAIRAVDEVGNPTILATMTVGS